ncbi:MAG: HEAT repeat domain-containing protein [Candidatus Nanohaloarchaea archaeon]
MAVFKCEECGAPVSKDVAELEDRGLMDETLPNYRIQDASDGEDLLPEGFFIKAEGDDKYNFYDDKEHCFVINLRDAKDTRLDYDKVVGCCGVDGLEGENTECKNGHKIGTERSDCWTKHALYLNPDKVILREPDEHESWENLDNEELLDILEKGGKQDKKRAAFLLAVRGDDRAITSISRIISDGSTPDDLRLTLIKSLRRLYKGDRKTVVETLIEQLEHTESQELRKVSACSLKGLEEENVRDQLLSAMKSEESKIVRRAIGRTLASYGSDEIVNKLDDILEDDQSSEVKSSAAFTLERIETDSSTDVLLDNLDQESEEVRRSVTSALRFRDDVGVFIPLVKRLKDEDRKVRENALGALCELSDFKRYDIPSDEVTQAMPKLVESLKDESGYIQLNAPTVIGRLGDNKTKKKLEDLKAEAEDKEYKEAIEKSIEELESNSAGEITSYGGSRLSLESALSKTVATLEDEDKGRGSRALALLAALPLLALLHLLIKIEGVKRSLKGLFN